MIMPRHSRAGRQSLLRRNSNRAGHDLLFLRFDDHIDTMAAKATRTHGQRTCAVEVSPSEVDAGAELTVTVRVSCPDGFDLRGQSVSIRNQNDTELATAELTEFDG